MKLHGSVRQPCRVPLRAQAKTFLCCNVINMLGNLWLASFAIGSIAVFLLMTMFAYIAQLDKLPPKAYAPLCPCGRRLHGALPVFIKTACRSCCREQSPVFTGSAALFRTLLRALNMAWPCGPSCTFLGVLDFIWDCTSQVTVDPNDCQG